MFYQSLKFMLSVVFISVFSLSSYAEFPLTMTYEIHKKWEPKEGGEYITVKKVTRHKNGSYRQDDSSGTTIINTKASETWFLDTKTLTAVQKPVALFEVSNSSESYDAKEIARSEADANDLRRRNFQSSTQIDYIGRRVINGMEVYGEKVTINNSIVN